MPSAAPAEGSRRAGLQLVRGPHLAPADPGGTLSAGGEVFGGLRVVRTLAMLSIVGYHVTWEPVFGIAFGLTSLQIIMCALAGRGARPRPMASFARKRALRLLAPWLAWSAIYAIFLLTRSVLAGEAALTGFEPWMWASGPSFHLWFLPFAFVASLAVNATLRLFRSPQPARQALAAALVGAGLLLAVDPLKLALRPANPFDLWLDGLPTIPFGIAIGRALAVPARVPRARLLLGIALAGLLPFVLGASLLPASGLYERYAVAIPVVCLGLIVPVPDRPWMAAVAATNLGVYLVHMLAIRVTDHLPGLPGLPDAARSVVVYALCLGAVLLLRRTRIPHLA